MRRSQKKTKNCGELAGGWVFSYGHDFRPGVKNLRVHRESPHRYILRPSFLHWLLSVAQSSLSVFKKNYAYFNCEIDGF